jgi:hypothetical protein
VPGAGPNLDAVELWDDRQLGDGRRVLDRARGLHPLRVRYAERDQRLRVTDRFGHHGRRPPEGSADRATLRGCHVRRPR